jgi:hypothetical protein
LQEMNPTESLDPEKTCQAVSPIDEPCDAPASYRCESCGRWFCEAHAEDEAWHPCSLQDREEGGEG